MIEVRNLSTRFKTSVGEVWPSREVSFHIGAGRSLALVGESGSGKSVTARAITRLLEPADAVTGGSVTFHGRDLLAMPAAELQRLRAKEIAMIFQDPAAALNPVLTIGTQIMRIHRQHGLPGDARAAAVELLDRVGVPEPGKRLAQYPHQFSGGMKQRVMIAMALIARPSFVVADEPTTALDVTVEAQVIALLRELQQEMGMSMLFISHNLSLVSRICDDVAVMYAGHLVEKASTQKLFQHPMHPYSRALLSSIPRGNKKTHPLRPVRGEPPNLARLPAGCPFRARCDRVVDACSQPQPLVTLSCGTQVACHVAVKEAAHV
ncbi:ABC transporter ATP-binding protein [Pararhizobium polonicum]|uniref:ABC transporter ATP-binding protein n=1 Tax=Pararhizobium polonicum TaxID=1612624 RepID=UPI001313D892|nr:ABC transporter ATP-binding protein [Pararhizobium polonicum]